MAMIERSIEVRDLFGGIILKQSRLPLCASKYECKQEAVRLHSKLTSAEKDTYIVERFVCGNVYESDCDRKYPATDLIGLFD